MGLLDAKRRLAPLEDGSALGSHWVGCQVRGVRIEADVGLINRNGSLLGVSNDLRILLGEQLLRVLVLCILAGDFRARNIISIIGVVADVDVDVDIDIVVVVIVGFLLLDERAPSLSCLTLVLSLISLRILTGSCLSPGFFQLFLPLLLEESAFLVFLILDFLDEEQDLLLRGSIMHFAPSVLALHVEGAILAFFFPTHL